MAAPAGLSLSPDHLDDFRQAFDAAVAERVAPSALKPRLWLDAELELAEINDRLMEELFRLEPHGQGNPAPLFCLRGIQPRFQRIVGEKHLKFTAVQEKRNVNAIAFGQAFQLNLLCRPIDLACACELNEFNGVSSLVLNVKDISPTSISY